MRGYQSIDVGNRSHAAVLRAPFEPGHYRALAGMVRVYPELAANLWRYLTARGEYPYRCRIRTPLGEIAPTLYSSHDISTVNEVFCRLDYRAGRDLGVAVDFGANVGLSALYFLTRNPVARVHLFEPAPENVRRLRANLAGYEDRIVIHETAVGLSDGEVSFAAEPTGRYGYVTQTPGEGTIRVGLAEVNRVLAEVLAQEGRIDLLKVDVEGLERDLVAAVEPGHLARIHTVYYETEVPEPLHEQAFSHGYELQTNRLVRRARDVQGAEDQDRTGSPDRAAGRAGERPSSAS